MDKRKGIILAVVLFLLIGLGTFVFADEPNDDPGKNTGETNGPSDTNNDGSTTNPDEESEVQDEENSGTDDERVTATNRRPSNSGSTQVIIGGNTGENTSSSNTGNGSNEGEEEQNPGEVEEEPDTTAPVITINGESYQGKGNDIGYVNGDVILSLTEENLTVVVTKDGEELNFEDDMILSSDGNYIITVTDEAGNVTEVKVTIDKTLTFKTLGITNITHYNENKNDAGRDLNIANIGDTLRIMVQFDELLATAPTVTIGNISKEMHLDKAWADYYYWADIKLTDEMNLEDGIIPFTITDYTDEADNSGVQLTEENVNHSTYKNVLLDTTAPVLNIGNGKIVSEFTVEATDDNFDYMLIKYFDGRKDEIIKDNTFEISGLGDNTRYNITVYDKAGNTSEYRDIYLDNQKPIITGTGLNPDKVELENGGFYQSVSLKISDGSLKKVVRVNDDGTETELATFKDNFKNIKMLYENTFDEEGTYNIKAIDRNNNEESITFTIDRTAPKRSAANILVQGDANELGTYYATYGDTIYAYVSFNDELAVAPTIEFVVDGKVFKATTTREETPNKDGKYIYYAYYEVTEDTDMPDGEVTMKVTNIKDKAGNTYADITEPTNGHVVYKDTNSPDRGYSTLGFEYTDSKDKTPVMEDGNKYYYVKAGDSFLYKIAFDEELQDGLIATIAGSELPLSFLTYSEEQGYVYGVEYVVPNGLEEDSNLEIVVSNIKDLAGNEYTDKEIKDTPTSNGRIAKYDNQKPNKTWLYILNVSDENNRQEIGKNQTLRIELNVNEKLASDPMFSIAGQEIQTMPFYHVREDGGYIYCTDVLITDEIAKLLEHDQNIPFTITNITDKAGNTISLDNDDATKHESAGYDQVKYDGEAPKLIDLGITGFHSEAKYDYHYIKNGKGLRILTYFNELLGVAPTITINGHEYTAFKATDDGKNSYSYFVDIPDISTLDLKDGLIKFTVSNYKDKVGNVGETKTEVDTTLSEYKETYVDNTLPDIEMNTHGEGQSYKNWDNVTVKIKEVNLQEVLYKWGKDAKYTSVNLNELKNVDGKYELTVPVEKDGRVRLYVKVVDKAGNEKEVRGYYNIDRVNPEISVYKWPKKDNLTPLQEGSYNYCVVAEATDNVGLASFTIDGEEYISGENAYICDNGQHKFVATDKAGNIDEFEFSIDRTYGAVTINNSDVYDTHDLETMHYYKAISSVEFSEEGTIRLTKDNKQIFYGTVEEFEYVFEDGEYKFEFFDMSGNPTVFIFEVDSQEPEIMVYKWPKKDNPTPLEENKVYNYCVVAEATDNVGLASFTIDGEEYTSGENAYICDNGQHKFVATDKAGNIDEFKFSIDKNKPIVTINNNDYQGSVSGIRVDEANISIKDENIAAIYVEKDGERLTDYDATTTEFILTEEGHYKITVRDNEVNGNKTVVELYVGKYNSSIVFEGLDNIVYDGKPVDNINIKIVDNDGNEVEKPILVNYYKDNYGEANLLKEAPTEAGNYVVAAYYYNEDGDYKEAWAQADFTIEKADLKVEIGTLANPVEGSGESKEVPYKIYGVNNEDLTTQLYADGAVVLTYTDRNGTTPVDLSSAPDKAGKYTFSVMVRETDNYNKATNYVHYEISSQPDHETIISGVEENGVYYGSISFSFSDEDGIKGIYYDFANDYQTVEALKTGGAYQEVNNTSYSGNWPIFDDYEGTVSFCIEDTLGNLTFIKDITIYKDHPTVINESLKTGEVYTGSIPFEFYDEDGIAGIYYDFENNYQTADDLIKNTTGIGALQDKGYYPVNAKSFKDTFKVFKTYNGTVSFCLVDTLGNKVFMNSITVNYLNNLNNN